LWTSGVRSWPGASISGSTVRSGARSTSASVRDYAKPPEQLGEELPEQGAGAFAILEFGGAEAEYLVPAEFEVPVTALKRLRFVLLLV